jgi:TM2 domain-containing membrane protein YozV
MNNTVKSWKGQPATNQVTYPYADWTGSAFSLSYNYDQSGGATQTYVTGVPNPINSPGIFRYYTGTTGYKYWAFRTTVPSAGTYTFSYYARLSGGSANTINMQQLWRDTDATDRTPTGNWNPTYTSNWVRYTATATVTSYLDMFICHSGSMTGGIQLDLCGFQLESGTYATPFVAGSRSTTTALVDLMGINTLTVSNLTYASNNTFSFTYTNPSYIGGNSQTLSFANGGSFEMMFNCPDFTTRVQGYMQFTGTSSQGGTAYIDLLGNGNTRMRWEVIGNVSAPGGTSIQNSTNLSNNTWYHIVGTFTSAGLSTIYVNGVADGSTQLTNFPTGTITAIPYVGNYYAPASGQIPVAKIYNTCLTADQVAQNFQALRGRYSI